MKLISCMAPSILVGMALLGTLGCVDQASGGGTGGTALYVYDNTSGSVMVWNDVNTVYASPSEPPSPSYTLTAGDISNRAPLAWGGMTLDTTANCLYLVSQQGTVTRINQLTIQDGAITQSKYLTTFTFANSNSGSNAPAVWSNSVFGQAVVNPSTNVLYVTENQSDLSQSRIWMIYGASSITASIAPASLVSTTAAGFSISNNGDRGSSGVAAGQGSIVYGYFPNGNTLYSGILQTTPLVGGRIRSGNGVFADTPTTSTIVGDLTDLSDTTTKFGSLAYDSFDNYLYVSRQASSSTNPPLPAVMVFSSGQFNNSTLNQGPSSSPVLGDTAATLPNLRFIAHARIKDWLAGADMDPSTKLGTANLYLWKSPSLGGSSTAVNLGNSIQVGGIAFNGNN